MKLPVNFLVATAVILLTTISTGYAQINNAKKETVQVYGNCGMCETTIEKSALKKMLLRQTGIEIQKWPSLPMTAQRQV